MDECEGAIGLSLDGSGRMLYPISHHFMRFPRLALPTPPRGTAGNAKPELSWLRPGDLGMIEIERIGSLTKPVALERIRTPHDCAAVPYCPPAGRRGRRRVKP